MSLIILILICVGIYYWIKRSRRNREERLKQRRVALTAKYGSEDIANKIIAKQVWQGMNAEQLRDSWGQALDVDTTVYKEKTKEVWKYGSMGKNRYRNRVTLENGTVVGWEIK